MASRSDDMQAIFNELSEENKDIMIQVAKGMKIGQKIEKQDHKTSKQSK